ncbi:SgrR family transcriptional regulator, partial [Deinococcus sp. 23YEL01]|nr:SgrR family transcriptional regulator [Deinococcus sp. 23YEL01]
MSPFPAPPTLATAPDWPYLTLRAALHARDGAQERHALTLADAQAWWACSDRTAKRQLARLHASGRLVYTPGRGRGNTSR